MFSLSNPTGPYAGGTIQGQVKGINISLTGGVGQGSSSTSQTDSGTTGTVSQTPVEVGQSGLSTFLSNNVLLLGALGFILFMGFHNE